MSGNHPITKLNTNALVCALTVMKAFRDQINLHQATMTPITVMPGVIAAYMVSPWSSAQACEPKKDDKRITLADEASWSNSNATSNTKQHCRDKHNPATPDGNDVTCLFVKIRRNLVVQ
jgi:hypothetical protein